MSDPQTKAKFDVVKQKLAQIELEIKECRKILKG